MKTETLQPPPIFIPFLSTRTLLSRIFNTDSLLGAIIISIIATAIIITVPIVWVSKVVNAHTVSSLVAINNVVDTSEISLKTALSQENIKYYVPDNETFIWGINGTKEDYCIAGRDDNSMGIAYYDSQSGTISWDDKRQGLCATQPPVKFTNGLPSKNMENDKS